MRASELGHILTAFAFFVTHVQQLFLAIEDCRISVSGGELCFCREV